MVTENTLPKRATFITIERPLFPQPLKNSRPYWYGAGNKLCFYTLDEFGNHIPDGNGGYKKCFDQEIPEAQLRWMRINDSEREHDVFEDYGMCEVFYDEHCGWQLRWMISHERAKYWLKEILAYIEKYHCNHFVKEPTHSEIAAIQNFSDIIKHLEDSKEEFNKEDLLMRILIMARGLSLRKTLDASEKMKFLTPFKTTSDAIAMAYLQGRVDSLNDFFADVTCGAKKP